MPGSETFAAMDGRAPMTVDLRRLKQATIRLYPSGHPLREAILREPDELPTDQAAGVLEAYLRMAFMLRAAPQ